MALIKCPECGKEISDKAKACPNCGCPLEQKEEPVNVQTHRYTVKKNNIGKVIIAIMVFIIAVIGVLLYLKNSTCVFGHEWKDATCEDAKTCIKCGETEGESLGHEWEAATCTTPETCNVCGKVRNRAHGHSTRIGYCTDCGEYISELAEEYNTIRAYCDDAMDMLNESMEYLAVAKDNNDFDALRKANDINYQICEKVEMGMRACRDYEEFAEIKYQLDMAKSKIYLFDKIDYSSLGVYSYVIAIVNSLGDSAESFGNAYIEMNELLE